jgi:hypothetical protein
MRAVIRIKFKDGSISEPRQALENFLRLEGFNLVDLKADQEWLDDPRQILVKDKIESFVGSMAKPEERGLKIMDYIFSGSGTEGIVASRNQDELVLIIYKHNLEKLKDFSKAIVGSMVEHFNNFYRKNRFSVTKYLEQIIISDIEIREDGRQSSIITGRIVTSRRGKRRRVHLDRKFEFYLARILIFLTLLALSLSFYANFKYGFKVEELNTQTEYWVKFAERITGPLIVTSSVLWFNLWSYKLKTMTSRIIIDWQ